MEWLSVNDLAKEIETPIPSVRRYIQKHQNFINSKKNGKKILVDSSCLDALKEIRKMYVIDNKIDSEVNEALLNKGFTQYVEGTISEESIPVQQGYHLESVMKYLEGMKKEILEKQENDKREILEQQQRNYNEFISKLEQRDYMLMEYIQKRREIAATQKKKWWKFR